MLTCDRPVLRLAHSPDPDDAFMWWPLFALKGEPPRIDTGRFRYEPVMDDIESLNALAESGAYEITAMSCAQYPNVAHRYAITACGSSMGEGYGPKLVARAVERASVARASRPCADSHGRDGRATCSLDALCDPSVTIAIPGTRTSAFATLNLLLGRDCFRYEVVPFDQIVDAVVSGEYAAGIVIHEGQLTFRERGLHLIEDLGRWWSAETGLPLPLGVNAVRRDLEDEHGEGTLAEIAATLLRSVEYALGHREESVAYALQFAHGMGASLADEFIGLYVNRWTLDFGDIGRQAVEEFLSRIAAVGLVPDPGPVLFVQPGSDTPLTTSKQRQTGES